MDCTTERIAPRPPVTERRRWLLPFAVEGDLRFLSHQDTLRLFERMLVRAAIPVRYSEGFNPHPRLMFPLPRPVGVASVAESAVVELTEDMEAEELQARLVRQSPMGLRVGAVRRLVASERVHPKAVTYHLALEPGHNGELSTAAQRLLSSETLFVERTDPKSKQKKTKDIRPYVLDVRVDSEAVEFVLRCGGDGSARPLEILELLGLNGLAVQHNLRRIHLEWENN